MFDIKKSKKLKIITASLIVVTCTSIYAYDKISPLNTKTETGATQTKDRPVGEVSYSPPTASEKDPVTEVKDPSTKPTAPRQSTIPISISYMGGDPLQVRVVIPEVLSDGKCSLRVVSSNGKSHNEQVGLFPTSSSTTCKGFSVSRTIIGEGSYTASITVTSGERTGTVSRSGTL